MPTYDYRCDTCHNAVEVVRSIFDTEDTLHVTCGGGLVRIFVMPHVGAEAKISNASGSYDLAIDEAVAVRQEKDVNAYRRLRKNGLQPKGVKGAAEVEQFAQSRFEVESGHRLSSAKVGKKYDETQQFYKNGGLVPLNAPGGTE